MPFKDPQRKRAYEREFQREWHARRKREFFVGMVCEQCGAEEDLELCHPTGGRLRDLTGGINPWSLSKEKFEDLLTVTAIYCAACKRRKVWLQHDWEGLRKAGVVE